MDCVAEMIDIVETTELLHVFITGRMHIHIVGFDAAKCFNSQAMQHASIINECS